ncbi:AP-4 complex subunit sigma-1-like [Strongylocentrotus purpuratus]|uniref:AP complex subunit sigma n=1 Tax=Strongylocentrotus purpuratus TaxID=7668 RepID=A0A7M7PRC6_STRPU|nr:AP-4 complex subunit sigma-1-like [Strongylocentrotus purpuratus]
MIKFVLMISKSGRTCFARYFEDGQLKAKDRVLLESDLIRTILARKTKGCSFFDYQDLKIIFRQFASVFIICGVDEEENEIGILEFIQLFVEILDSYFPKVSDFDVMFNLEKVHIILEEMLSNGYITETRKSHILSQLRLMDSNR